MTKFKNSNLLRSYRYGSAVFYDLTLSERDLTRLIASLKDGDRLKAVLKDTLEDGLDSISKI